MGQGGWATNGAEVWPVGEEHVVDSIEKCPCAPWLTECGILVHKAYDRREFNEPDGIRPGDA